MLGALPIEGADQRRGDAAMIAAMAMCAGLTAVDGDTVRCDGQLMRLPGGGVPFQWGTDTREIGSHAKRGPESGVNRQGQTERAWFADRNQGLLRHAETPAARQHLSNDRHSQPFEVVTEGPVNTRAWASAFILFAKSPTFCGYLSATNRHSIAVRRAWLVTTA